MSNFKNNPIFRIIYNTNILKVEQIINLAKKIFKEHREIGEVYLCGSYAKGNAHGYSDIDFLVFFNRGYNYQRKLRVEKQLESNILSNLSWWRGHSKLEIEIQKPVDLFDGDYLIHKGNHITGDIFKLYNEAALLVYKKEGFVSPPLAELKEDYERFQMYLKELKTSKNSRL